ncbi:GNAT family N-acetyltransferase [Pseudonocardia nematodicida]|uniref:GNAT family N-acetyltransferase n=1 Tax=Pseudonocardia nematodicida TaxID=1206997 RepID=A0ABV1K3T4_9PSEU
MTSTTTGTITRVDPRSDPLWARLAGSCPGNVFTSPPWLRAVCGTYGFTPEARIVHADDGEPAAGVAFVDLDDVRGRRRTSLPFCDRADPLVRDPYAWPALARDVARDAAHDGVPWTLRRVAGELGDGWVLRETGRQALHTTPLDGDLDELHARLHPGARRNLRAAAAHGVTVRASSTPEAVRVVHAMHAELRRGKYRMLAPPLSFFENVRAEFAGDDAVVVLTAVADGTPIAAGLFLIWRDTLYYKVGASDPAGLRARPNDALFWAAVEWAVGRGLREIDWGVSDLDQPGLIAYKRKWASAEEQVVRLSPAGPARPATSGADQLLHGLTDLLTRHDVPHDVTVQAGALLYRYFG